MTEKRFSPNEFLRARRPERFSDSVVFEEPTLDRTTLEYHLDTLTNRGQENQFEEFARRLAEREICPNLLPHTGPTGGGDSKVDSETFPVADALSLGWFVGTGREAASERWAFAFSAKKDWRAKVRSDIKKIAGTGRGYTKAFFVTNQFVPDKARAAIEDKLRRDHNIDVRILDRTWILNRVFMGRHEELAVEALGITTPLRREVRRGPLDTQREQELDEVDQRIHTALRGGGPAFQFVDDCLAAATLARDLERPRTEVEGRFARAERVAVEYGTPHQKLESLYQRAWTAFFWYEDYKQLPELYQLAEERAKDSRNANEIELLTNLWLVLRRAVHDGELSEAEAGLSEHTAVLTEALERLRKEHDRPSTALQARTLLLQMRLAATPPDRADAILRELTEVVRQCEGLVGYPLEPLAEVIGEIGGVFGERAAYNTLFEAVVETTSRRAGEIAAARALLTRGAQQLDAGRYYPAIRTFGRALGKLHRHESRRDLVHALYLCANAYERVGLLWAARGTLLVAASVATNEFWTSEEVTPAQRVCYNRLKWIELRLGRLPQILAWQEVDRTVAQVLAAHGYDAERMSRGELPFDAILGILCLKADLWHLQRLSRLPDVLDQLGLYNASAALLYALGHVEALPEALVGGRKDEGELFGFFATWRDQPAAKDVPGELSIGTGRRVTLVSRILGCQVTIDSDSASPCVELAESTLAALEALLATGPTERMMAHEPTLAISVRKSEFADRPFGFEMKESTGRPHVEIYCADFHPHELTLEQQTALKRKLFELLAQVLAHVFWFGGGDDTIASLFDDGHALERSIDFTTSFVTVGNVLGHEPKMTLGAWTAMTTKDYPLKRSVEWDVEERGARARVAATPKSSPPVFGTGEPPEALQEPDQALHSTMATVSLIRMPLWERAGWSGTMFAVVPGGAAPPMIAPIFKDKQAARLIIEDWYRELGEVDATERLRITIIRGVHRSNPHAYRVMIGSNLPPELTNNDSSLVFTVSRSNTMAPASDVNLQRFLESYRAVGRYFLAGAESPDGRTNPRLASRIHILKHELNVRDAWQISKHDPDAMGVRADDDPIIPQGQQKAPVLELLKWLRERRSPP